MNSPLWWKQWIAQVLPFLVPYKKWKTEHRNVQKRDIVLVLYDKKIKKGEYRLGRVLNVHPDMHGRVRTVTVGLRRRDRRENALPYNPKPLDELTVGVQRLAVICPAEEQSEDDMEIGHREVTDLEADESRGLEETSQ